MSHAHDTSVTTLGSAWNRFWFTPSDPLVASVLRLVVGAFALIYQLSFTVDLVDWFGPYGLLPRDLVAQISGQDGTSFHVSLLNLADDAWFLWMVHGLGALVLMAFTVGFATRLSAVGSLAVVLSYVHRAPMIAGELEPVLTMLLSYLCLTPCGEVASLDAFLARRGTKLPRWVTARLAPGTTVSAAATVGVRLMQIHLAGLYLSMATTKLAGDTWWVGEAVWWLIARSESRLVDLTSLNSATFVLNAWCHGIVLLELAFPILIWNRRMRPWLVLLVSCSWAALALLTGLVAFCGLMIAANLVFADADQLRRWSPIALGRRLPQNIPSSGISS